MAEQSSASSQSQSGQPGDAEQLLMRLRIATELLGMAYTLWVIWQFLIPEHQRRLILMRAAERTRRSLARAAFRAGHQAMGLELSGPGMSSYRVPYLLSRARDAAARAYERLRYAA